jgi:stringent starvation protein B
MKRLKILKPYLVEAAYNYTIDSKGIPYAAVHVPTAIHFGGYIPDGYEDADGIMSVNCGPNAAMFVGFKEHLYVECSFNKVMVSCIIPYASILALYDRDTREGISFDINGDIEKYQEYLDKNVVRDKGTVTRIDAPKKVNHLRIIK